MIYVLVVSGERIRVESGLAVPPQGGGGRINKKSLVIMLENLVRMAIEFCDRYKTSTFSDIKNPIDKNKAFPNYLQ